ncbi:MAG: DUF4345 family protein [Planctomycetes bacterium]|nr:DUF4345 family protein [Planctomycetota bacterium]
MSGAVWAAPFARALLGITGALYVSLGLAFALEPVAWAAKVGLSLDGPGSVTEVRAFYGGLELGLGALFVLCALRRAWIVPGVLGLLCTYGGLAAGRGLSLLGSGPHGDLQPKLVAVELSGTALSALALWALARGPGDAEGPLGAVG